MRCLRIFMLLVVLLAAAGCGQGAQEREENAKATFYFLPDHHKNLLVE